MIKIVPVQPLPAQTFSTSLNGQTFRFRVMQKSLGLFVDVYLNDELIVAGVLALNGVRLIRAGYLNVIGNFAFIDSLGTDDPSQLGLGTRFLLVYSDE